MISDHVHFPCRFRITVFIVNSSDEWLKDVEKHVQTKFSHLKDRWFPHFASTSHGCRQDLSRDPPDNWEEMDRIFGDYARFPRQQLSDATPTGHWDLMSVDGRFRDGCMLEALNLVKPEYGMIMLDNSERVHYRKPSEFPSHWLVTSFQSSVSETTLWMACPTVTDANCSRARQEIAAMMNNLPKGTVGSRYTAHMARAKLDGVPGA